MNTMAVFAAMIALGWLAFFCFNTLANNILGYVTLFAFGVMMPLLLVAIMADVEAVAGRRE